MGRYELGELRRETVAGNVHDGRDLQLGRPVAIRLLDERFRGDAALVARVQAEVSRQARLVHPHILAVLDCVASDGLLAVVTEAEDGENLSEVLLREPGPMPMKRAARLIDNVLSGLAYAHEHGMVHGALEPSHVLLQQSGGLEFARLADFGARRMVGVDWPPAALAYAAPEQLQRRDSLDARSDLYSCGALMYRLVAGCPPFEAESEFELMQQVVKGPVPSPPGVPDAVRELVRRALHKDPAGRFPSARGMQLALQAAVPEGVAGRQGAGHRRGALLAVSAALVTGAGVGTYLLVHGGPAVVPVVADGGRTAAPATQAAAATPTIDCPSAMEDVYPEDLPEPKPGPLVAKICGFRAMANMENTPIYVILKASGGQLQSYTTSQCEASRFEEGQTVELSFEGGSRGVELARAALFGGRLVFEKTDCVVSEAELQEQETRVQADAERDHRFWEEAAALGSRWEPSPVDVRPLAGITIGALLNHERIGPVIRAVFGREGVAQLESNSGTTSGAVITPDGALSLEEWRPHMSSESVTMVLEPTGHLHAVVFTETDEQQRKVLHYSSDPLYFRTVHQRFRNVTGGENVVFHPLW
ncbi:MAG: serine/threonine protein kinase [Vicinamibacteria bacterium]|nr:serine/threonine protein kinase [Vicinamibacteria bacterium]